MFGKTIFFRDFLQLSKKISKKIESLHCTRICSDRILSEKGGYVLSPLPLSLAQPCSIITHHKPRSIIVYHQSCKTNSSETSSPLSNTIHQYPSQFSFFFDGITSTHVDISSKKNENNIDEISKIHQYPSQLSFDDNINFSSLGFKPAAHSLGGPHACGVATRPCQRGWGCEEVMVLRKVVMIYGG